MNPYQRFIGIAFQMLSTVLAGVLLGIYLDDYFKNEKRILTIVCSLSSVLFSLIWVIRNIPKE